MEFQKLDTGTENVSITLLPDRNPPGTENYNSLAMVDAIVVIKDGVCYDIVEGGNR